MANSPPAHPSAVVTDNQLISITGLQNFGFLETKFEDLNPVDTIELHMADIVADLFVIEVVETHGLPDFCIHGNDL